MLEADYIRYLGTFDKRVIENFPTIEEVTPSATSGAYEIKTGTDFAMPNNTYLVGLAKVNNRGQVAPVASVRLSTRFKLAFNNISITRLPQEMI